jgi:transcriptional regulator with XRE-family HTH domain
MTNEPSGTKNATMRIPRELRHVVRVARIIRSWTQETLAETSGVELRTIQLVERGGPPSLQVRQALDRALGLDGLLDELDTPISPEGSANGGSRVARASRLGILHVSWFGIFGAMAGALSLFNLFEHIIHFHIYQFFKEILEYYRAVAYPFATPARTAIATASAIVFGRPLHVPRDILILYALALLSGLLSLHQLEVSEA